MMEVGRVGAGVGVIEKVESKEEEGRNKEKEKENIFSKIKEALLGKFVILYGEPFVGKTTFAMNLARFYVNKVLLKVDKNYDAKDYDFDGWVVEIESPTHLLKVVEKIQERQDQIVILDSITSLDAHFIPKDDPLKIDPRLTNVRTRFFDAVLQRLSRFKKNGTVLVICHERIVDFATRKVGPRINVVALRHVDMVLRMTIENGRRKITKEKVRVPTKEVEFFGDIF